MSPTSDAYILVTIPDATLTPISSRTLTGQLVLEYVTYDIPPTAQVTQDVLLVLVLRSANNNTILFEVPLDPARALSVTSVPPPSSFGVARRRYVFHATRDDAEFTVELPENNINNNNAADDIELFHSVLVGYLTDVRVNGEQLQSAAAAALPPASGAAAPVAGVGVDDEDLRGRFVLMDEDDGEIVGTLDRSVRVYEDPSLGERGHEKDTLVVEVPEGAGTNEGLLEEEVLVNTIPPEDRDWVMKTAVFVSHAISGTTTLLTSAMTGASNLYIAHSTPSTSAPGSTSASPRPTTPSSSSSASKTQGQNPPLAPPPPPPPSRTLLLLQSPTTRKNLTQIHAVSGSAAKLSSKAAATVENLIQRAVGLGSSTNSSSSSSYISNAGRASADTVKSPKPTQPSLPPRSRGPSPAPPDSKPLLPPRNAKSPRTPSPSGSRAQSPALRPQPQPQLQQQQARTALPLRRGPGTGTRVAISAALILASIEASAVRLVEAGGAAVSAAVTHKYGTTAGENATLAGRTARNIVLVYVDVRGLGRRVIVKRMAKKWVKGRIASARQEEQAAAAARK